MKLPIEAMYVEAVIPYSFDDEKGKKIKGISHTVVVYLSGQLHPLQTKFSTQDGQILEEGKYTGCYINLGTRADKLVAKIDISKAKKVPETLPGAAQK